jgi:alkylation response protein AidB-like acyl-CoA dehydrogenase
MQLVGTPEHQAYRERVRAAVERHVVLHCRDWEEHGAVPAQLHASFARAGITTARISQAYGGAGKDFSYSLVLAEELMRASTASVTVSLLLPAGTVIPLLAREASPRLRTQLMSRLVAGDLVLGFGVTEPEGGSDLLHVVDTTARSDGDCWVINGRKLFVTNGPIADYVVTLVRTGDKAGPFGKSFIAVPVASPGVVVSPPYDKLGLCASPTGFIDFHEVRVPKDHLIGRLDLGLHYLADAISEERILIAAGSLELARSFIADALLRLGEREGSSAVVARLISCAAQHHGHKALVYEAADSVCAGRVDRSLAALVKFSTVDFVQNALEACADAMQLCGGLSAAPDYARALRDSRVLSIFAGTSETMRDQFMTGMLPRLLAAQKERHV